MVMYFVEQFSHSTLVNILLVRARERGGSKSSDCADPKSCKIQPTCKHKLIRKVYSSLESTNYSMDVLMINSAPSFTAIREVHD